MLSRSWLTFLVAVAVPGPVLSQSITLTQNWRTSAPPAPFTSAPAVGSSLLFAGTASGQIVALDKETGKVVWSRQMPSSPVDSDLPVCVQPLGIQARPVLWEQNVYVADGQARVRAFDSRTGEPVLDWDLAQSQPGAYIRSNLIVAGNALYAAVSSATGQEQVAGALFRLDLRAPFSVDSISFLPKGETGAEVQTDPVWDPISGHILVATGPGPQDPATGRWSNALLALDPVTLEIRASYLLPQERPGMRWSSSPSLFTAPDGNRMVAIATASGNFYVLSTDQLSEAWVLPVAMGCSSPESGCGSLASPLADNDILYIGAGLGDPSYAEWGNVYALHLREGVLRWAAALPGIVFGQIQLNGDRLVVNTSDGIVLLDKVSGNSVASVSGAGVATVSGDIVYFTNSSGEYSAVRLP